MTKAAVMSVATMMLTAAAVPAHAVNVALFSNTTYVDYRPGNIAAEASNLQATLMSEGQTVTTFTGITAAAINAAVAGNQVLAIPELETHVLNPDLDAAARTAIANFVNGGGLLLMFDPESGDPLDVLNATFGFSMSPTFDNPPNSLNPAGAAGTPFAGGPATIPSNNATATVDAGTLPSGARIIYIDNSGNSVVTLIPFGAGRIVIFGWDWYDARPTGSQDGGWLDVLNRATGPGTVSAAPALSPLGIGITILALAALGTVSLRRRQRVPV
jgi:hypothetical protein